MPKISETSLKAILAAEKADALAADSSSKLSKERADAMDYYMGDVTADIPDVVGKSRAVSSDVADTVEGLMPALMEIFCGGEEVVKFSPQGPEDEKAAEQETDFVNHIFMQKNPGFLILYSFIKDALLSKNGFVKVWTEEEEKEEKNTYYDQPDDGFALIMANPEIEVIEHSERPQPDGTNLHDVTTVCKKKYKRHRVVPVPPEEFGVSRRTRVLSESDYCFHDAPDKTVGGLIQQGYDEKQVKALPGEAPVANAETQARDTVDEGSTAGDEGIDETSRSVKVTEHYIRIDYEGSGKPKLYRIVTGGTQGEVLRIHGRPDVTEIDAIPFATMTPVIMTHRLFGRSIADLVMDIMRIKTALLRGMMDNLYLHNNARVEVAESHAGVNTLDDLLVSRPGGVVRTKTPGGLQWQTVPDITASIYPALEYFDATREWRTGVTRQGQGIDANALQNQTATAANQMFTMAMARVRLIARIFAETGIRDLFTLLHGEIRKNGDKAQTVRLRNEWVTVDPTDWKERNDLTIDVGLGTGGKQQELANITHVLEVQKEFVMGGLSNVVQPKNLYNSAKELTKLIGKKDPGLYFSDPEEKGPNGQLKNPPPPPKPDPDMVKVETDAKLKTAELQMRGQELQAKAMIDQQADERKAQIEQVQAQADMATEDRKLQGEMIMAQQKFEFEKELKLMDFQLKREQHEADMQMKREAHQQALQSGAFKMAAGAEAHGQKMEMNEAKASQPEKADA